MEKQMSDASKTFLITGVSSGFGHAFALAALAAGHTVVGTVRNEQAAELFGAQGAKAKSVVLDVTAFDAIGPAIAKIESDIGPIEVLVNNAGYGHEGVLEESSLDDMRRQ